MRKLELKRITAALRHLTPDQRKNVAVELAALDAQPASTVFIERRFACGATCPHCKSIHVIRHGHANGLQRYRCREYCKRFSALTGTPLNRLHPRRRGLARAESQRLSQPGSKPGYKSFAVWPRATWPTISAGFVPSTVNKAMDRNPCSGWLWRSVKRSNNMICEQSLYDSHCRDEIIFERSYLGAVCMK